jgi:magnesium transporter
MVDFIEDVPGDVAKRAMEAVSTQKGELIDRLLDYPDDSAGTIMTTEIVELTADMTVTDALHSIRTSDKENKKIYTCYVIDEDRKLIGVVTADTLLYAQLGEKVSTLMETNVLFANTTDDQEELSVKFSKYDLLAMPVVNRGGQLVGIVTVDDILRVITEEDTEDFAQIAGVSPSDEPYLNTGVVTHARHRIVWLLILMLAATVAGFIIDSFDDALMALPVLGAFIPMLMGAGGNAGAQSSTVVIRGMALGEIVKADMGRLLWRELRIAAICAAILGSVNFVRILIMHDGNYALALVVTASLVITVIISKSIGCTLPVIAKTLKMDPAVMAAPLITTIVDISALVVFFVIARMALGI